MSMLTSEVIESMANNAAQLKSMITSGDEAAVLGGSDECCSPKFLKFKFILCDVEINNINAVAAEDDSHGSRPC